MVPGSDQQQRGGVRADPVQGQQPRGAGGDEGDDELVQALELAAGELRALSQLAQRDADGVADGARQAGTAATPGRRPGRPGCAR